MNDQCMNTSATTTQTHAILRRITAGALLAAAITTTTVGFAATSHAEFGAPTTANCKTDRWGFLGSQRRTLCDSPITSDGSWSRQRTIWKPASYTPYRCSSGGGSSYSTCYGGYSVPEREISNETYPVRPQTVLPDEPGHLG
jgi:hypothetical protein